jgi:hypothetical protein
LNVSSSESLKLTAVNHVLQWVGREVLLAVRFEGVRVKVSLAALLSAWSEGVKVSSLDRAGVEPALYFSSSSVISGR